MFLCMDKKHAALVPRIAKTLKEMKADGTCKAIRSKTLNHFDLHRDAGPQHYPGGKENRIAGSWGPQGRFLIMR